MERIFLDEHEPTEGWFSFFELSGVHKRELWRILKYLSAHFEDFDVFITNIWHFRFFACRGARESPITLKLVSKIFFFCVFSEYAKIPKI